MQTRRSRILITNCHKASLDIFRRVLSQISLTILYNVALKQDFIALGKALSKHGFLGKYVTVRYHVFHNLCSITSVKQ